MRALAEEREPARSQLESVAVEEPPSEVVELRGGNVRHLAARLAHQMLMRLRQVEERCPVAAMDLLDHAPFLERFERAVHRRRRDRGVHGVEARRDVVDGEVLARAREQLDDRSAWGGDAFAALADQRENADGIKHDARLRAHWRGTS